MIGLSSRVWSAGIGFGGLPRQGRCGPQRLEIDQTVTAVTWKSWRQPQVGSQEATAGAQRTEIEDDRSSKDFQEWHGLPDHDHSAGSLGPVLSRYRRSLSRWYLSLSHRRECGRSRAAQHRLTEAQSVRGRRAFWRPASSSPKGFIFDPQFAATPPRNASGDMPALGPVGSGDRAIHCLAKILARGRAKMRPAA